ncbi:MAG TPA: hypothetical protein VJK52_03995 [Candidatus Nanoarchaeia archaeon]|nr:hypothetical protein [Candidatus Nanoarchaeia archaeon]
MFYKVLPEGGVSSFDVQEAPILAKSMHGDGLATLVIDLLTLEAIKSHRAEETLPSLVARRDYVECLTKLRAGASNIPTKLAPITPLSTTPERLIQAYEEQDFLYLACVLRDVLNSQE